MLTDHQQQEAIVCLEEFVAAVSGDPIRLRKRNLDELQTILAGAGLTIELIQKPKPEPAVVAVPPALAAALMPASALPPAHVHMTSSQLLRPATPPAPTGPGPRRLTEIERGIVNTADMAASDLAHKPGYTFRASTVASLVKIIRAVTGETR